MHLSNWAFVLMLASSLWCADGLGFSVSFGTGYGDQTCGLAYGEPEFLTNFKGHHFVMEEALRLVDKLYDDMLARRSVEGRDPDLEVVSFWEEQPKPEVPKRIRLYSSHNEYKRELQAGMREPDSGGGNLKTIVGIPSIPKMSVNIPELDRNAFSHFGLNDGLRANFGNLEPFVSTAALYTYVGETNPASLLEDLKTLKAVDPNTNRVAPWLMSTSRGPNPAARRIAEMMLAVASEYLQQPAGFDPFGEEDQKIVCVRYHKLNSKEEMVETREPWCHSKKNFLQGLRRIGWALHYLGDFFVPMHALGKGAEDKSSKHVEFESWVESWATRIPHHPGYILKHGKRGTLNLDLFSRKGCKDLLCSSEHLEESYKESCEHLCEFPTDDFKGSPYNSLRWAREISGPLWKFFENLPKFPGGFKIPTIEEALRLRHALWEYERQGGKRSGLLRRTAKFGMDHPDSDSDEDDSISTSSRTSSERELYEDDESVVPDSLGEVDDTNNGGSMQRDSDFEISDVDGSDDDNDVFYEAEQFPGEKYARQPELSDELRRIASDDEANVDLNDIVRIMKGRLGQWPDPTPTGEVATDLGEMLIKGAMVSTGEAFTDIFKQMRSEHQTPVVGVTVEQLDLDVSDSDRIPEWFNDMKHYQSIPSAGVLVGLYNSFISSTGASRRIDTPIRAVLENIPSKKLSDGCKRVAKSNFWKTRGDSDADMNEEGVRRTGSIEQGVRRMHPNAFNANNWSMLMSWPHYESDGILCNEDPELARFRLFLEDNNGLQISEPIVFEINLVPLDFGIDFKLNSEQEFICNWRKAGNTGYDEHIDIESQTVQPLPNNWARREECEEHEVSQKVIDGMNHQCGVLASPQNYDIENRLLVVKTPATLAASWLHGATLRFTIQVRNKNHFASIEKTRTY